jgi:NitT/TauT family transport system substrate-binding protein
VAGKQFIAEHPDAIKKFLAAYQEALKLTIDDPGSACATISELSAGALTAKACESQLQLWLPLVINPGNSTWGTNDAQKWASTVDILKTYGGATGSVATEAMYTNDYLPGSTK